MHLKEITTSNSIENFFDIIILFIKIVNQN